MRSLLPWMAGAAALALAAACGGNVIVDKGAGGAGGTGGTGGLGGAGGAPLSCGGKQGIPCPAGQWCEWDTAGLCGADDSGGTCRPGPTGCPEDCPGVCGCNGAFYCNACDANAAGFDVSSVLDCVGGPDAGTPPPQYQAWGLATNVPRYAIAKLDFAANQCTWVIVAGTGGGVGGFPGIQTTMGWGVESVFVTDSWSDCMGPPSGFPMPMGQYAKASDGAGDIKQDSASVPHFVSVHVKLAFPPVYPWVPSGETLDADQLEIQGGI